MITKIEFLKILNSNGEVSEQDLLQVESNWNAAEEMAACAAQVMPGIGFLSTQKRLNAFFSICRFIDDKVSVNEISNDQAQLALQILRLSNKSFEKAIVMFELRKDKFDVRAKVEMPDTARIYLAGMGI